MQTAETVVGERAEDRAGLCVSVRTRLMEGLWQISRLPSLGNTEVDRLGIALKGAIGF